MKPTELNRPDNTGYGMPTCVYTNGENLSIPARMEDQILRDAVERCEPTQGANLGTDSGRACL